MLHLRGEPVPELNMFCPYQVDHIVKYSGVEKDKVLSLAWHIVVMFWVQAANMLSSTVAMTTQKLTYCTQITVEFANKNFRITDRL